MSFDLVTTTLSAALAINGTTTINYPANRDSGSYSAVGHRAQARGLMQELALNTGFTLAFGAASITLTYRGTTSIPAGTALLVQLNRKGADSDTPRRVGPIYDNVAMGNVVKLWLGAPKAAAAAGVCASQGLTLNTDALINGSLAVSNIATFDNPRNVVAAWTGVAVLTVTGRGEYGNVIVESSASGSALVGKKAFKTITKVRSDTTITLLTVGSGVVLGLPIYLGGVADVLREQQDGAVAVAGVVAAGVSIAATALTGDTKGTYAPSVAPDGLKAYDLIAFVDDPTYQGVPNFAG